MRRGGQIFGGMTSFALVAQSGAVFAAAAEGSVPVAPAALPSSDEVEALKALSVALQQLCKAGTSDQDCVRRLAQLIQLAKAANAAPLAADAAQATSQQVVPPPPDLASATPAAPSTADIRQGLAQIVKEPGAGTLPDLQGLNLTVSASTDQKTAKVDVSKGIGIVSGGWLRGYLGNLDFSVEAPIGQGQDYTNVANLDGTNKATTFKLTLLLMGSPSISKNNAKALIGAVDFDTDEGVQAACEALRSEVLVLYKGKNEDFYKAKNVKIF